MEVMILGPGGATLRAQTLEEQVESAEREAGAAQQALDAWRAQATMTRMEIAKALKVGATIGGQPFSITHLEALAFVRGEIPAPFQQLLDLLPAESIEDAEIAAAGGQPWPRKTPLWDGLIAHPSGPTEAEIDALYGWPSA